MQSQNRILDEIAKLVTSAAGAAKGVRDEVETLIRAQAERLIDQMDLVTREEYDVVKAMVARARAENEKLEARIAALEATPQTRPQAAKRFSVNQSRVNRPRRVTRSKRKGV